MGLNLEKGENKKLANGLSRFHIGLGWDVREDSSPYDFDLDVSAFMIGANKKVLGDAYVVFYNSDNRLRVDADGNLIKPLKIVDASAWTDNDKMRDESRPVDPELSVIGSLDDEDGSTSDDGDDETMDIDLSLVRPDVKEIVICVSIYHYAERRQNFGQVERAYVRLYRPGCERMGAEEYIYDLTEDFSADHSVEFCRLYRHNGEWKIQALGIGHKGGLEELVAKFT